MDVTSAVLLKGAWCALEQCGNLLRDAIFLHSVKAYPSAVALAMIGREELGKHRMLLDEWRKSRDTGKLPSIEAIRSACADHVDKQRRAVLGLTFRAEADSAFGKAISTKIKRKPQDTEYREAEKVLQAALNHLEKRTPDARHAARVQALYVDLNEAGTDWNRPLHVSQDESKKLLSDAANDYASQQHRLNPELLREMDDLRLAEALEAWDQRSHLPPPVWPE
jgi:AbiV family abortive infection protein